MNRNRKKIVSRFLVVVSALVLMFVSCGNAFASHQPGGGPDPNANPPQNRDPNPCTTASQQGGNINVPGGGGGVRVPVDDDETQSILRALANQMNVNQVSAVRAREYLRLLCEKEYEEDHILQHAWANLIGDFVAETTQFIARGYGGNPAFLTNQNAYYQLVNITVARVFMQDVIDSNIGNETKREIVRKIAQNLFGDFFPYTGPITLGDQTIPTNLAADNLAYTNDQYWREFNDLSSHPSFKSDNLVEDAAKELSRRQEAQVLKEQEKLSWGRGFFSFEICDLAVYVRANGVINPEDRRNCRIATPGSLVQDQTSFVFGSALRQMEINDEYEEWVAPNTLAVLADVLSYRGFVGSDARHPNAAGNGQNIPADAASPTTVRNQVGIQGGFPALGAVWQGVNNGNADGDMPYEFNSIVDVQLWNLNGGPLGGAFFLDVLDPDFFLRQIP